MVNTGAAAPVLTAFQFYLALATAILGAITTLFVTWLAYKHKQLETTVSGSVTTAAATQITTKETAEDVKEQLEKANRHIARQEMLLMVLLKNADLADAGPPDGTVDVPAVAIAGSSDDGIVIVGGTRYVISKAVMSPRKK